MLPSTTELVVILFIILLLFGGKQLPELARSMGSAVREFTEASKNPPKKIEDQSEKSKKEDEKEAILEAARKLGIETEGRSIQEIAQDLIKATDQKTE